MQTATPKHAVAGFPSKRFSQREVYCHYQGQSGDQEVGGRWTDDCCPPPRGHAAIARTSCTDPAARTRPQARRGCSDPEPAAGRDLRSPRRGQGSGRPPGWALPGPPARGRLPLTSLGGEPRACPRAAAAALRPDARRESGPRGRAAEAAARAAEAAAPTPERRPSLSALREAVGRGRRCPLRLLFLSPSSSPHHSHFGQPGSPSSQASSPPSPGPPSSQRLRRYWLGRPICVGVYLHSGCQFTAD